MFIASLLLWVDACCSCANAVALVSVLLAQKLKVLDKDTLLI